MKNVLMIILAILGGLLCWDVLDRALGGPGLLPRLDWQSPHMGMSVSLAPVTKAKPGSGFDFGRVVKHAAVYEINGFLGIAYFILDRWHLIAAVLAELFVLYIVGEEERLISMRPARRGEESLRVTPGQAVGLAAIGIWTVCTFVMPAPIPYIGAAMFTASALALAALPTDRPGLGWRLHTGLILYALICLAYRVYLSHIAALPPEVWAKVMGSVEEARAVMAQSKSYVNTIANLTLWIFAPAGFFSILYQAVTAHPARLVNPLNTIRETIALIRTRERGEERW